MNAQNDWWWAIDNVRLTSPFKGNPLPGVEAGQWSFTTGDGAGETLLGDINGNNEVDFADFLILSTNFGTNVEANTNGDLNGDSNVDFADFLILSTNFGNKLEAAAADRVFADA